MILFFYIDLASALIATASIKVGICIFMTENVYYWVIL
jgi:hypothetical protein